MPKEDFAWRQHATLGKLTAEHGKHADLWAHDAGSNTVVFTLQDIVTLLLRYLKVEVGFVDVAFGALSGGCAGRRVQSLLLCSGKFFRV
eukprot:1890361-Amphidinium_carterae.2